MAFSSEHWFRISGIPTDWTDVSVLGALKSLEPPIIHEDQHPHLSLYPACAGLTLTGLLKLENCSELLEKVKSDKIHLELSVEGKKTVVDLDGDFYNLTPLNTLGNEHIADVISVHDLGGHPFETWMSNNTGKMWLMDFLPGDVTGIRVMNYGYNSSLSDESIDIDFLDHRRNFLQVLDNSRRTTPKRPLIFIGHGMGGILILQALLQSNQQRRNSDIFESTRALFFFGVPHQGQNVELLLQRIQGKYRGCTSFRTQDLKQLNERSGFLSTQREDITYLFNSASDLQISTFYETIPVLTLEKTAIGGLVCVGDRVKIVDRNSTQLFLPHEHRIPVGLDHFDMVKFHLKVNPTYETVITHMHRCVNNIVKGQNERDLILSKELCECLKSLNESGYRSYRDKRYRKRHAGTCSWIFSNTNYRYWLENDDSPIVWIHGGPGFGKSVLSAVLSKELSRDQHICFDQECSVAYYCFDDKDVHLKTSHALLTTVIAQLLRQDPKALVHFSNEPAYNIDKEKTVWTIEMLWRVLNRIVNDATLKPMFVIIDALDECEEESRSELLAELKDLLDRNHTTSIGKRIKIVITSRPHILVESYFPDVVEISLDTNNLKDIADYVHASDLELKKNNFPTELRQEIQKTLIEGSNGMFLWVYLILDDLKTSGRKSPHAIRTKLKSLPKTLPDLYKKILYAIKPNDVEIANDILRWVVWAERPLTLRELTTAIAIQPEHRSMSTLTELMEPNLKSGLRSILGALITVQSDIVYLVHQSAKDFLKEINSTEIEWLSLQSNESNLHIAVSCMTYLSFDEFENPIIASEVRTKSEKGLVDDPFFDYASSYWPAHMKQLDDEFQQAPLLKNTFLYLAQSSKKLTLAWNNYRHHAMNYSQGNIPLVITTNYGVPNMIQFLLDDGADINAWCNEIHGTALHLAATNGMKDIVRFLVERGADINTHRGNDGSALQAAVRRNLGGIVRLLLEPGADCNALDDVFGNLFQLAAAQGIYDIGRYLVEHRPNVIPQGSLSGNALQAAADRGHNGRCHYLVKQGANVNAQSGVAGNALTAATDNDHQDIVNYPVEQGANVNAQDGRYSNPLQDAAHKGKLDIVCHLVETGADVNIQGGNYGNALQAAARRGHNDICHFLVEQGANVNAQGGYFGNALQAAAYKGYNDICHYLVEQGADVNIQGGKYGNALQAARCQDNRDIVDYLLENGGDLS